MLFSSTLVISLATTAFSQSVQLIVRSDDMGFTHAANEAMLETYKNGITTSIEVMVPTPWFPEAVKMLREYPDLDVGVHLTLTSEWSNIKWRPVTSAPSLTDSNGYFYPMIWPNDNYGEAYALKAQDWKLEEVEQELRAQIELAKRAIPQLTHVTGHMGCTNLDERVKEVVRKLTAEYDLAIFPEDLGVQRARYQGSKETAEQKIDSFIAMLENLTPGKYLFVDHPAYDNPEVQAVNHIGYTNVATDRQGVTDLLTNAEVKKTIRRLGIELIDYYDLVQ